MLEYINRWLHGYVIIPVISTLDKSGFFDLFAKQDCVSLAALTTELSPNLGHFKVALRLLESLGWLQRTEQGLYSLTALAQRKQDIQGLDLILYQAENTQSAAVFFR